MEITFVWDNNQWRTDAYAAMFASYAAMLGEERGAGTVVYDRREQR